MMSEVCMSRQRRKIRAMVYIFGVLFLGLGVALLASAGPVSAQSSTGTPMVDLTATAMVGTAPVAPTSMGAVTPSATSVSGGVSGTLAAPGATVTGTALVPVTGADLSTAQEIAAAQTRLYLNLGVVALGVFLLVLGILIKTGKR